jgi:hypothetical protein
MKAEVSKVTAGSLTFSFLFLTFPFPGPARIQASSALAQPRTARLLSGKRAYYS